MCMCMCAHTHICVQAYVCMYVCMHCVCACVCLCVCVFDISCGVGQLGGSSSIRPFLFNLFFADAVIAV